MRFIRSYCLLFAAFASALVLCKSGYAEEVPATEVLADNVPAVADVEINSLDTGPDGPSRFTLPAAFHDVAFDSYADLNDVAVAFSARDASLLTDVALQLGEGERILLRQHKSGVTAGGLLEKAARLAADNQDQETLARLAKVADQLQDGPLAAQLASLEKIGSASRATDPALTVSLETVALDVVIWIKNLLEAIQEAVLVGDGDLLDEVESQLSADTEIADAQKAALTKLVKNARDGIAAAETAEVDPIAKLAAASRWGLKDLDPTNKNSGIRKTGRDIDRERTKAMDSAMGGRYEVTIRNPTKGSIFYTFDGERQIALLAGYKRTHRGVGNPRIRFDSGTGDGSYRDYRVYSGRTYHFAWKFHHGVGAVSSGNALDLFQD